LSVVETKLFVERCLLFVLFSRPVLVIGYPLLVIGLFLHIQILKF